MTISPYLMVDFHKVDGQWPFKISYVASFHSLIYGFASIQSPSSFITTLADVFYAQKWRGKVTSQYIAELPHPGIDCQGDPQSGIP